MNPSQPPNTLTASGIQYEVLYATPSFQVRLWTLQPEQAIAFPQKCAPKELIHGSQYILIAGELLVSAPGRPFQPQKGKHFVLDDDQWILMPKAPSLLFELCWGAHLSEKPLKEVTEERPWGSFTVLKDEPNYKMKQLAVKPGSRLSLQRHFKREEHWLVTKGSPEVFLDGSIHHLQPEAYIHIPLQSWHRIMNPENATELVEIVELQLGDYFGEDDIERQQDDYGRQ